MFGAVARMGVKRIAQNKEALEVHAADLGTIGLSVEFDVIGSKLVGEAVGLGWL